MKRTNPVRGVAVFLGALGAAVCLFLLSSGKQTSNEKSAADVLATAIAPSEAPTSPKFSPPSASEIYEAASQRKQDQLQHPEDYLDPNNRDPVYRIKVARHHRIGAFVESPLREDPRMRDILIYLLENGYGIDHWAGVVGFLYNDTFLTRTAIHSLCGRGMSMEAIETALVDPEPEPGSPLWFRQKELARREDRLRRLGLMSGISDPTVLDGLLGFEPTFHNLGLNQTLTGDTVATAQPGDRLYTDEDWLAPEFIAAKATYTGEPRPSRWEEQTNLLGIAPPAIEEPTEQNAPNLRD